MMAADVTQLSGAQVSLQLCCVWIGEIEICIYFVYICLACDKKKVKRFKKARASKFEPTTSKSATKSLGNVSYFEFEFEFEFELEFKFN